MNIANNIITNAHPTNPNSSAKTEKIKSLCGSGKYKYFCLLNPKPEPNSPPEPIAYKLCITCHPLPKESFHGSKNVVTLANLYGSAIIIAIRAGIPMAVPRNNHLP